MRRAVGDHQRIAVRLRAHRGLDADRGAAARPVVDHHRLPKLRRHRRRDQARHHVVRRAGRERRDDLDRPVGKGLRRCGRRDRHDAGADQRAPEASANRGLLVACCPITSSAAISAATFSATGRHVFCCSWAKAMTCSGRHRTQVGAERRRTWSSASRRRAPCSGRRWPSGRSLPACRSARAARSSRRRQSPAASRPRSADP